MRSQRRAWLRAAARPPPAPGTVSCQPLAHDAAASRAWLPGRPALRGPHRKERGVPRTGHRRVILPCARPPLGLGVRGEPGMRGLCPQNAVYGRGSKSDLGASAGPGSWLPEVPSCTEVAAGAGPSGTDEQDRAVGGTTCKGPRGPGGGRAVVGDRGPTRAACRPAPPGPPAEGHSAGALPRPEPPCSPSCGGPGGVTLGRPGDGSLPPTSTLMFRKKCKHQFFFFF